MQTAITALSKLTGGPIHLTVAKDSVSMLSKLSHVVLHKTNVLHPAGNVGTQINKIDPINKGETVWTVAAQDLVIIGELFLTGKYNAERIVALAGSCVKAPKYYKTRIGSEVATMLYDSGLKPRECSCYQRRCVKWRYNFSKATSWFLPQCSYSNS